MAFNFNWSPLTADAGFYSRAQDLLTAALNKSPKPPIIVDDIVVTELNLGSVPPELEILEVGDLAEDRFRGIFKMSYSGDAFLTLKTRVQANPLNTYLVTRPSFASPEPLAADVGLTIPLQITLSNFNLSGFVILVFSKQKGITVVFRNDPLESLKVSSTFDSIPFVRDYLQKEIEAQLRILFMDELPAIIHRLSLRLWVPEYRNQDQPQESGSDTALSAGPAQDPLLNAPLDPVDATGNVLSSTEIASLSLDSGVEMHSLFSRKNLLRLGALTDSHRTLSLFTPSIRDVVFRARTGTGDHTDGLISPVSPPLSRIHSQVAGMSSALHETSSAASVNTRSSYSSAGPGISSPRHPKAHARKRKKRVVDLRPKKDDDAESISEGSMYTETASTASSVPVPPPIPEEPRDEIVTPPLSPGNTVKRSKAPEKSPGQASRRSNGQDTAARDPRSNALDHATLTSFATGKEAEASACHRCSSETAQKPTNPGAAAQPFPTERSEVNKLANFAPPGQSANSALPATELTQNSTILEQAWMMTLASEIARRIQEGKPPAGPSRCGHLDDHEHPPPPAYQQ